VVVVVLLVTAYYAVPGARAFAAGVIGVVAVSAIEYGIYRMRPQRHVAWQLIALAIGMLAIGDVIFVYLDQTSPRPVPYPSTPDLIGLAAYVPLTIGLLLLGRPSVRYRDETTLIDAIIITLAGSLVVWVVLVRGAIESHHLGESGRITAVAGWVGYIAVLAVSVRVVLAWRRNTAMTLLGLAVLAFLVADFLYGHALVRGEAAAVAGGPVDLGYLLFSGLCGTAALTPSMRDVATPVDVRHALGPLRLTLVAIGLLVAPTILLAETGRGRVDTGLSIAVISVLVSMLMLLRLSMTGRAYQRRAAREYAVRLGSQAMVTAATPEDVLEATRSALRSVLPGGRAIAVRMVRPYGGESGQPRPVDGPGSERAELAMPLAGTDAALLFIAPANEINDLNELLSAISDQAALALQRIGLAQQAGAEERERYFRTLVTTSTDVILISRDGRVDYATPSAQSMFGHDIVGECFDDLVHPSTPAPTGPQWPDTVEGAEARVTRPDGEGTSIVVVRRRDLTDDPTVRGVVTTMRDVTAERALQRDLAYRASHDDLTGLANVRQWGRILSDERERRVNRGDGTAVLFVDLDDFKSINDTYGHAAGDQVLIEVARRIRANIRANDLAARIGGDEFAVLLRGVANVEDARAVAARVADALARPAYVGTEPVDCGASIGLAHTELREEVASLVGEADTALYAAKNEGKGHWREYAPGMPDPHRRVPDGTGRRRDGPRRTR
jgi:diguanylate cyclase (GGDEF)-like protein